MAEWLPGAASALWLGILTSISPCPLATNITAIFFVGRHVKSPRKVLLAGLLYTLGRSLTYLLLGVILVGSLLSAPRISHFLQNYMNKLLGPILILAGMFLLDLVSVDLPSSSVGEGIQQRLAGWGIWGGGALGIAFALSFCPVSAALFFGSLVPLAIRDSSSVLFPTLYGIGTGLPVLVFAALASLGANAVGKAFDRLASIELWARRATGLVFVGIGIYYSLTHIFGLFS
jgi:cytochrome c-type biogenesis protein